MVKKLISFTEKEVDKLNKLSEETGLGMSEIIRRIIDEYFESKKVN